VFFHFFLTIQHLRYATETYKSDKPIHNAVVGDIHCEPKKHTKMFLSSLLQNPTD